MRGHITGYLDRLQSAIDDLPLDRLETMGEILYRAYRNERQVFTVGNGGSASTASHMAADLGKNTIGPNMRRFRILSLKIVVPSFDYGVVEDLHLIINHILVDYFKARLAEDLQCLV